MNWKLIEYNRRILGSEEGSIVKDWGGKRSIVLVYPNTYEIGMSNLGLHKIYKILNDNPNIVCERAFLPNKKNIDEHIRTNNSILSIESQSSLADFDIIVFTVPFENDYLNILKILELSKIPFRSEDRNKKHPTLITGGAAITINPNPLKDIFDALFIGEFEKVSDAFIKTLISTEDRASLLKPLSKLGHFFVPRLSEQIPSKANIDISEKNISHTVIFTKNTEFGDMHLVEIQRGCPWKCKFCVTATCYHPPRNYDFKDVAMAIDFGLAFKKRIGLIGPDVLGHPQIEEIVKYIKSKGATFSPASIRTERLLQKPQLVPLAVEGSNKTLTLAPEAGSERLRFFINKKTKDNDFVEAATMLINEGTNQLKLYFMIGLPSEVMDDILSIPELVSKIRNSIKKKFRLIIKINPFIPKPGTPFEKSKMINEKDFKNTSKILRKEINKISNVKLEIETYANARLEYNLCNALVDISILYTNSTC
ncbi:B12-binding domain-containing radical SAM protein [bacterium]|nr:B12-binding domain-containing radical SAM protein [bacterium]